MPHIGIFDGVKHFSQLFQELEQTTKTNKRIAALKTYFDTAPDEDKLWTVALFTSRRPRRTVSTTNMRQWAAEESGVSLWLFEEAYHNVGDLAETISLMVAGDASGESQSLSHWINQIKDQKGKEEEEIKAFMLSAWSQLSQPETLLFNKLITGGFRIGIAQKSVVKALAQHLNQAESHISHRLMGNWTPETTTWSELLLSDDTNADLSRPYPFYLAYSLDKEPEELGDINDWQIEYKWDGIRSQLIKRNGELFLWTRGEELVTGSYPEFDSIKDCDIDNFAIDGELVVYTEDGVQPFQYLQKRLGRKTISKKWLRSHPCAIIAYDLLEYDGEDMREVPLATRREKLEEIVSGPLTDAPILISEIIRPKDWADAKVIRLASRENRSEGLMLKLKDSTYKVGRKKGEWYKWKVDPYTVDAVMLYAQRGHGRRSGMYTDFTFAVWQEDGSLVPFAKAYTGLTDAEFAEITKFVTKNTIERFGPVRSVKPELVFELAFEGIAESSRHKSGIALRFPRIKRWRRDKKPEDANTLADLKLLL